MITTIYTNGSNPDFVNLCKQLDSYFNEVNSLAKHEEYNRYNTPAGIADVWIVYEIGKRI